MENELALIDRKALLLQRFSGTIANAAIKLQESTTRGQQSAVPTPTPRINLSNKRSSSENLRDFPAKKVKLPLAAAAAAATPSKKVLLPCSINLPPPPSHKVHLLGAPTKVQSTCTFPSKKWPSSPPSKKKKLHLVAARKRHFANMDFSQERDQAVVHATPAKKWQTSLQKLPADYMVRQQAAHKKARARPTKEDFLQQEDYKARQSEPDEDAMHTALEVAHKVMQEKVLKQRQHDREEARRALEAVEANATIENAWQTTTEYLQFLGSGSKYAPSEVLEEPTYASNLDCAGRLHINFLGNCTNLVA